MDNVGNVSKPTRKRVVIDMAPAITTLSPDKRFSYGENELYYMSGNAYLKLIGNDELVGPEKTFYQIDRKKIQKYKRRLNFKKLSEGKHKIEYFTVDLLGNKENPITQFIYVDKTNPKIKFTIDKAFHVSGDVTYVTKESRFTIVGSDDGAGMKEVFYNFNEDPNWMEHTQPFELSSTLKYQTINYWGSDKVSNKTDTIKMPVVLDNDLPRGDLKIVKNYIKSGQVYYVGPNTNIDFNTIDDTSGVRSISYELNDLPAATDKPLRISTPGDNVLVLIVKDNVGHENRVKFDVKVDTDLPQISGQFSVSNLPGEAAVSPTYPTKTYLYLSAQDQTSGVSEILYIVNNGDVKNYKGGIFFEDSGTYNVKFYAVDYVGNVGPTETMSFEIVER